MNLCTDGRGHLLVKATGEDGRVVLIRRDGSTVIINETHGKLFTSDSGAVEQPEFEAGRVAGIVKEGR